MKKIWKRLKLKKIDNWVYRSKPQKELPTLLFPSSYQLKILNDKQTIGINLIDSVNKGNNICYKVFDENKLIHTSWVIKKNLMLKQLGYHEKFTVSSSTHVDYRGKGIFSAVLNKILHDFKDVQFLGFVKESNIASIKGLEKAGYTKGYRFKLVRLFGIKIYLKRYDD